MTPARNCCSVSSPQPTNAEHWASPATGRLRPGAGSSPNTPPPSACSTGCCTTPTSSSPKATPTACAKPEPKEASTRKHPEQPPRGGDFYLATSGDFHLAIDTRAPCQGVERPSRSVPTPTRLGPAVERTGVFH